MKYKKPEKQIASTPRESHLWDRMSSIEKTFAEVFNIIPEHLYTLKEVSEILGVSFIRVKEYVEKGMLVSIILPQWKEGGHRKILVAGKSIIDFLVKHSNAQVEKEDTENGEEE